MEFDYSGTTPLFQQIAEQIEEGILNGSFKEGEQIPSTTEISKSFAINPATVLKGMNVLVERELIEKSISDLSGASDPQSKDALDQKMRQNIVDLLSVIKDESADYVTKGKMMRNVVDHIVFDRKNKSLDIFLKIVI